MERATAAGRRGRGCRRRTGRGSAPTWRGRCSREQHHRDPGTEQELTGFLRRVSRPARSAVAGFDLTFSPVKSVSTLWAVAPREISERVEAAHHAAVAATLAWLEKEVGYTRVGTGGPAQVDTRGLVMAQFTHRDSRAGDPDLHTHVAVSNKVQTLDGRWLALDARMLYRFNVAGSEYYNTALEAELTDRPGCDVHRTARRVGEAAGAGDHRRRPETQPGVVQPGGGDHRDHQPSCSPGSWPTTAGCRPRWR